jgi:hypothetical protein
VLGGPAGGAALQAVSNALLGKPDGTEAEISARIENWKPEDELALRNAEQAFTLAMVDKAVALEQVDAGDRANARKREVDTHDWTTRALALTLISLFAMQMFLLTRHAIPAENRDAANQLLGILYVSVTMVLSYYFGSSSSSRTKDAILGRVAEAKK